MPVKRCQRCFRQEGIAEKQFELVLQANFRVKFRAVLCKGCAYEIGKGLDYLNFVFENQLNVEVIGEVQTQFTTTLDDGERTVEREPIPGGVGTIGGEDKKRRRGGEKG